MRLAPRWLLLSAITLTVVFMSAASASAFGPLEVHDETGTHCNPCPVEFHGESFVTNAVGTPLSTCEDTLHAEVHEDGQGHITELINAPHAAQPCTTIKCTGVGEPPEEAEWPFRIEESAPAEERFEMRFCLDVAPNPGGTGLHCDLDAHVGQQPPFEQPHHYEVSVSNWPCAGGQRLWNVSWEVEGAPIEIEHPLG